MAYACWCQFAHCILCQQRLPKLRTIFLRMFGAIAQSIICKPELAEYRLGYQMSSDSSGLCEVRVPTFRRPKLLRRALLSVLEQTYSNWRCVVLDDCPDGSARSIVEAIQDHRIDHLQNPPPGPQRAFVATHDTGLTTIFPPAPHCSLTSTATTISSRSSRTNRSHWRLDCDAFAVPSSKRGG